jgi:hypothetical protein
MYGWLALEIMSKGSNIYITIHPLNLNPHGKDNH